MTETDGPFAILEGRSATLFVVAGGLLLVFAANTGFRTFTDASVPAIHSVFGPGGFFVGVLGLFGVYPALADRSPKLARAVGVVAAIPLVGWFLITALGLGNAVGVLPGPSVVLPGPTPIVVFLTTMLAYLLFGATTLRTGSHPRTVGFALLLPAVPFLALMVAVQVLSPAQGGEFVIDTGHALAHLAVGLTLRSEGAPTDRAEPAADATP